MKAYRNLVFAIKKAIVLLPTKREKMMVVILWLLALSSYFVSMLFPTIQMWITDGVNSILQGNTQYHLLILGFSGLLISTFIGFISRRKLFAWSDYVSSLIIDSIYGDMLRKSARIKYKYFDQKEMYDKLMQTSYIVPEKIASLITWNTVPPIIGGVISMTFVTVTLVYVHWSIAILVTVGNIASIYFYYRRMKDNYYLQVELIPQKRWAEAYWGPLIDRGTLKEVQVFGLFDYITQKWKRYSLMTSRQNFLFSLKYSAIMLATDIISILFKILALIITLHIIIEGKASIGAFMLVYGSINVFSGYLSDISKAFINISENSLHIDSWLEYMGLEDENIGTDSSLCDKDLNIEFINVKFKYVGSERLALDGISLKIEQGEKVAIVGENGSGKSTFVSMLNGLYDDYEGKILVNGQDVRQNISILRSNIITAFQDYGCYEFSIKDNVRMGDIEKQHTDAEIRNAARMADALEFIDDFESGIDTEIGPYSENGVNLSGGQWQKIALARTFINPDAKLLVLDEPTASLDPFSESVIYRRFIEQINDQTAIMISHRLGATKFADRILVFDKGKIVEDGNHDELMSDKGLYWDMYTSQSRIYKEV